MHDVKINDVAPIVRLADGALVTSMTKWAWPGPRGAPVFNFRSEGRRFGQSDRVLIPVVSFLEYTSPDSPKVKLKDQHEFTMVDAPEFFIAGVVQQECFSMLTVDPGPDVQHYHDRQVVVLSAEAAMDWLTLSRPEADILRPSPSGSLQARTLRRNGVDVD
ncbi:MAG: SOS response-associated peptidase family protein [Phenylobacterium sp.]|nr:SOS response-associated peptidase family protein [Phenylobacterium sp.]